MRLQKGTTLIEASAGSGKTYTLCRIVLRLIVLKNIPIDRILAVTFTNAATSELQGRIQSLLKEVLIQCDNGKLEEESLFNLEEEIDLQTIKQRLQLSLDAFDEAQISTIHGFCKRALDFIPLESGIPFDASFEQVEDSLFERLRNEYIVSHLYHGSPFLASIGYSNASKLKTTLESIGKKTATYPHAELLPKPDSHLIESLEEEFKSIIDKLPSLEDYKEAFLPKLKKNASLRTALAKPTLSSELERMAARGYPNKDDLALIEKLSASSAKRALLKAHTQTEIPSLFEACEEFSNRLNKLSSLFAHDYRTWLQDRLKALKESSGTVSFDDLLHILNRAIGDKSSSSIQNEIASLYDAVLVDEFQDTDPVQYNILNTLFGKNEHYLFYIGDPKQAIYSFRGADIQTYFEATQDESVNKESLGTNYRSTPEMVSGSNTFFSEAEEGFVLDSVQFQPAVASNKKPLTKNSPSPISPGLRFELIDSGKGTEKLDLVELCHHDVRLLLSEGVPAGKMAVLVNNRFEANLIYDALSKSNIPSEIRSDSNIFKTKELDTILLLLSCLARPSQSSLQRSLIGTSLFNLPWSKINLPEYKATLEKLSEHLYNWSKTWDQQLFAGGFNGLLHSFSCIEALSHSSTFERSYTNLLQIAELASEAQLDEKLSPKGLLNWLERRSKQEGSSEDSWQTRLQSDSGKLQITTIFGSKGLEYGYVFLPFMSQMKKFGSQDIITYHNQDSSSSKVVIELSQQKDSDGHKIAEREFLAEQARLIYVALTRAVNQTRVYLSLPTNSSRSKKPLSLSPIINLMIGIDEDNSNPASEHDQLKAKLDQMQSQGNGGVSWELRAFEKTDLTDPLASESEPTGKSISHPKFEARPFKISQIPQGRLISSFSALSHQVVTARSEVTEAEAKDKDLAVPGEPLVDEPSEPGISIHTFPKGAKTGDLFHAILENLDFSDGASINNTVDQFFESHQFGFFEYKECVSNQIRTLVEIVLPSPTTQPFSLKQIHPSKFIAELEFIYPVDESFMSRLVVVLEENLGAHNFPKEWIEKLKNTSFFELESMLRGFIDLIVEYENRLFIIDWKSNYLGPSTASYSSNELESAMAHHDYYLQYCLYSVALKRFLLSRHPQLDFEEVFGGVYYIFLRGLETETDNGIYFDRPSTELINAFDAALGGTPQH
ncbi:exodeoxyribonuclease V subunit beta [Puniceicoccaceae bacterium K14]|nr:exodeoxyribonuclease V subunit beta [Puniceicoccaceae bacterium K14]